MARLSGLAETIGRKVSRTVTDDDSIVCAAKWDYFARLTGGGLEVTAAQIQVLVDRLKFFVNGGAEVFIGTYTGNTGGDDEIVVSDGNANSVAELLAIINGMGPGQPAPTDPNFVNRWRGGLGDFRPGFGLNATSLLAAAAAEALVGRTLPGVLVKGDSSGLVTANLFSVGIGTPLSLEGAGALIPDGFQASKESDVNGNIFSTRRDRLFQQQQPALAGYEVALTQILCEQVFAANAKVVTVFDINDNIVATFPLGAGTVVNAVTEDSPVVGPVGSPLFVECTGSGVLTDGPMTVSGYIRRA